MYLSIVRLSLLGFIAFLLSLFLLSTTTTNAFAISCKEQRPGSAPILLSATPKDHSVELTWTEAIDPVTYYLVAYGTSPTSIEYGYPDVGGKGTTSFTVNQLANGLKYYFWVRAGNGCKPGKFSNKLSAIPGTQGVSTTSAKKMPNLSIYKPVLGTSTSAKIQPKVEKKTILVASSRTLLECTISCSGWPFLFQEVILLLVYFYASRKYSALKPTLSFSIPILTYLLFSVLNKDCMTHSFSCKYFLLLSISIFLIIAILHKRLFIHSAIDTQKRGKQLK